MYINKIIRATINTKPRFMVTDPHLKLDDRAKEKQGDHKGLQIYNRFNPKIGYDENIEH